MVNAARRTAYRFGSFTLDLKRGALMAADGREMALRPKSFALLRLLVENAGRLVSKEEIMEALWPDIFVTENNITQCIHDIRCALGPEAHQTLRTRARRGYLFASEILAAPPAGSSSLSYKDAGGVLGGGSRASREPAEHQTDEELPAEDKPGERAGLLAASAIARAKTEALPQQLGEFGRPVRVQDYGVTEFLNT